MSTATEIKSGDVVRLKSGGPSMTVRQTNPPRVTCEWFAGDEARINDYEECQLVHVPNGNRQGLFVHGGKPFNAYVPSLDYSE